MGPDLIVNLTPPFDEDLGFRQRVKDLYVEKFVSEPAVETLDISILPGTAWFNLQRLDSYLFEPVENCRGREFRAVVTSNVVGSPAADEKFCESIQNVLTVQLAAYINRETFPSVFIDQV